MKLFECVTRPQVVLLVVVSFEFYLRALLYTHAHSEANSPHVTSMMLFEPSQQSLLSQTCMDRLKQAISRPFTCPLLVSTEKGHAIHSQHAVHCLGRLCRSETMNSTPPVMCDYQTYRGSRSKHELTYLLLAQFSAKRHVACMMHTGKNMGENSLRPLRALTGIRCKQNN